MSPLTFTGCSFRLTILKAKATDRSLANLAGLVESEGSENIILLDNGDIIQGDPLAYYYNYVDTTREHVVADILNHLGYDACNCRQSRY